MSEPINEYNLKKLKEFVQPAGKYLFPPNYSMLQEGWKIEMDSGWLKLLLETAKALLEYDQVNGLGKLPESTNLDKSNLRQVTIEHHDAFLDLINSYSQEHQSDKLR